MIDISLNNTIQYTHGDTFSAELFLDEGNDCYCVKHILQEGEYVCFAIEEPNQPFEKAIVRKIFTKDDMNECGNVVVRLDPSDTINMLPGMYFYEIKAYTYFKGEPIVSTVVNKTKFLLL